jgi:hypothetical protein
VVAVIRLPFSPVRILVGLIPPSRIVNVYSPRGPAHTVWIGAIGPFFCAVTRYRDTKEQGRG